MDSEKGIQKQKKQILMADLGLLLTAVFWGGGFVAAKFALQELTPVNIMAYRYIGAAVIMAVCCVKKFPLITRKMVLGAGLVGALIFIGQMLQTIGLQYTTPGKQTFIISLYTVLVPLLSWMILKVKPSRRIAAAALVALAGISLLTLKDDLTLGLGDGLTFLFAITFSLQVVFTGIFMRDMDATLFTFLEIAAAGILSLAAAMIGGEPQSVLGIGLVPLGGLLYVTIFSSTLAFLLQNLCQRFAPANHTAILLSTETVFGTIFAVSLAGEVFQGRMIVGCALMFVAIFLAEAPLDKLDRFNKAGKPQPRS